MVQTSWRVAQTTTENRNMSMAVRLHTEAGRKQVGDDAGVSSVDEKSSGNPMKRQWKMEKVVLTGPSEIIE